MYNKKVDK